MYTHYCSILRHLSNHTNTPLREVMRIALFYMMSYSSPMLLSSLRLGALMSEERLCTQQPRVRLYTVMTEHMLASWTIGCALQVSDLVVNAPNTVSHSEGVVSAKLMWYAVLVPQCRICNFEDTNSSIRLRSPQSQHLCKGRKTASGYLIICD